MKYECKENDALIELGKDKSEVLISIQGDTSKIIIGVKDLKEAMSLFGIFNFDQLKEPKKYTVQMDFKDGTIEFYSVNSDEIKPPSS